MSQLPSKTIVTIVTSNEDFEYLLQFVNDITLQKYFQGDYDGFMKDVRVEATKSSVSERFKTIANVLTITELKEEVPTAAAAAATTTTNTKKVKRTPPSSQQPRRCKPLSKKPMTPRGRMSTFIKKTTRTGKKN